MLTKGQVKIVRDALVFDSVRKDKFDTWTVRYGYFYRHGQTPEKVAEAIAVKLNGLIDGMVVEILATEDHWQAWPKSSFFLVKFRLVPTLPVNPYHNRATRGAGTETLAQKAYGGDS